MSRLAKLYKKCLLSSKLAPKPSNNGHYYQIREINDSPRKALNDSKSAKKAKNEANKACKPGKKVPDSDTSLESYLIEVASSILAERFFEHLNPRNQHSCPRSRPQQWSNLFLNKKKKISDLKKFSKTDGPYRRRKPRSLSAYPSGCHKQQFQLLYSQDPHCIAPEDYITRLIQFGRFGPEVVIIATILIKRAFLKTVGLTHHHFHKLVSGCFLVAHKYLTEGSTWCMKSYGKISGVTLKEAKKIEIFVFTEILGGRIFVDCYEFEDCKHILLGLLN